ncbi:MAG: hypothetical protein ABI868_05990 [Acidobacteriota bacterium]
MLSVSLSLAGWTGCGRNVAVHLILPGRGHDNPGGTGGPAAIARGIGAAVADAAPCALSCITVDNITSAALPFMQR